MVGRLRQALVFFVALAEGTPPFDTLQQIPSFDWTSERAAVIVRLNANQPTLIRNTGLVEELGKQWSPTYLAENWSDRPLIAVNTTKRSKVCGSAVAYIRMRL
jgi:hypothetical protein